MPHAALRRLALATAALALGAPIVAVIPSASADPGTAGSTGLTGATGKVSRDPLAKLTTSVKNELADGDRADFWVRFAAADLADASAISDWRQRGRAVVEALHAGADEAQQDVRAELDAAGTDYTSYWVSNSVLVHDGSLRLATTLAQQSEVTQIRPTTSWVQEVPTTSSGAWQDTGVVPWGIQAVHADDAWKESITGEGITVANLDTGVDVTHPALRGRYRGLRPDGTLDNDYNFYDVAKVCPSTDPCDLQGHGTHTMGTMLGAAPDHEIGVAPGAKWIAANGCAGAMCSDVNLMRSAQWLLAPTKTDGTGANPDLRPDIINNSWGGDPGSSGNPFFDEILRSWDAAGIFSAWSIGNSGPACGTAAAPGGRTEAYSVGAYGHTGDLAFFSSRGPGQDGRAKPDIAAPGMAVVSARTGGGYVAMDGTSMAAPHVAGAVALLWSERPELIGDLQTTRELLDRTAHDVDDTSCGGTPTDNPSWGEGYLDATALLAAPVSTFGTLTGTVVDADGQPINRPVVEATGDLNRTGFGQADGTFSLPLRPATYQVTISAFGYLPTTRTVVVPAEGGPVALGPITLAVSPRHTVSGTLTQPGGHALIDTRVTLGPDVTPVTTGEDGTFTFTDVPEGTYTVSVEPNVCGSGLNRRITVDSDETLDLVEEPASAAGYAGCRQIVGGFRAGVEEHRFASQTTPLTQPLPFAFPWFGTLVTTAVIAPDGYLRFDPPPADPRASYHGDDPGQFPDTALTAAVVPFFDALRTDAVYTDVTTVDGEPAYVVEWRDAVLEPGVHPNSPGTLDFSVTLTASGDAIIGWGPGVGQSADLSGASAIVGFQSAVGVNGQFNYVAWGVHRPVAQAGRGLILDATPSGFVQITLTDAVDGLPLNGAQVTVTNAEGRGTALTTDASGRAEGQLPLGDYTLTSKARGYLTDTSHISVSATDKVEKTTASLGRADAAVSSNGLRRTAGTGTVTVANNGTLPMTVSFGKTAHEGAAASAPIHAIPAATGAATDSAADNAPPVARQTRVLSRFKSKYDSNSGVATDGTGLWTNELYGMRVSRHTFAGALTHEITAPYERTSDLVFSGDLAYETRTGHLCAAIHGENTGGEIRCYSPTDGSVQSILHGSWEGANPTGLAYNAAEDVFYAAGGYIFTIAGPSHPEPGKLLHSCRTEDPDTRGLAYNASTGQLWVSLEHLDYPSIRSPRQQRLLAISPSTCEVSSRAALPDGFGNIGGLDIDPAGRLWLVDRSHSEVLLVDVDDVVERDVPWLKVPSGTTTIPAGTSRTFPIGLTGSAGARGQTADVVVRTSSGRDSTTLVPVTLLPTTAAPATSPYRVSIEVGGHTYRDATGVTWAADRKFRPGGWGYQGSTRIVTTRRPITGTGIDRPFQTARVATGERLRYRFAAAPTGTYSIDLGFAAIDRLHKRERIFDVIVDGRTVLRHVDPARTGVRRALTRALQVEHRGGPLTVTLVHRRGVGMPLLSTLSVTEQQDR